MGGASQAFDHGTAAMAQNPATLGLMQDGTRLDVALGVLGPNIKSSVPGMPSADSTSDAYLMPAIGYIRKSGPLSYGVGLFAQGGMGTEYGPNTFLAGGSGDKVHSELSVGKLLIPLAYQVNQHLTLGATLDLMWANMDLLMAVPGAQLAQMVTGAGGNLAAALGQMGGAPWARINFSDDSKYTGVAKGTGHSAKVGAVYALNREWNIGASYQFKSKLNDMTTGRGAATMTAMGGFLDTGAVTVVNFQWPSIAAVGVSWKPSSTVLVAADVKSIAWADVMKSFQMRYDSAAMGGQVSFAMPQNWKDQTVVNVGASWRVGDPWTLRAGVNLADNPVPDNQVNPLFPATIRNHFTAGFEYQMGHNGAFNVALTIAPKNTVTNASGITIEHDQRNLQLMYSHQF